MIQNVAVQKQFTLVNLFWVAVNSHGVNDHEARIILGRIQTEDKIDWARTKFVCSDGEEFTAQDFIDECGDVSPVTRTLANYLMPLVQVGAVTDSRICEYDISRVADTHLIQGFAKS